MNYRPEFDGLRAISVLAVMAFHAKVPGFHGGFLGVDVFFVLSGYLITSLLMAEHEATGTVRIWAFYGRRLRRLYPALLLMLAVYLIAAPHAFPQFEFSRHLQDAALSALYVSDYARVFDTVPVVLGHTWSLSIEEQFYLAWPLLLLILLALPRHQAIGLLTGLVVASTVWRWANVLGDDGNWRMAYNRFDTHASGLLVGCMAAYVKPRLDDRWAVYGFGALALAAIVFRFDRLETALAGFTVVELAAALIVIAPPAWLGAAPLVRLGKLSYGIYLWHFPIMLWAREQGGNALQVLIIGGCLSIVMAYFSYHCIEVWFRTAPSARVKAGPQPSTTAA